MGAWSLMRSLSGSQWRAFTASFLGWSLDAFDFFLVTFVTLRIAKDFNVGLTAVLFTVTLTLMMRPVGALIFGIMADRFGRRTPMMIDILFYSIIELLTAFSPNYFVFVLLRGLFGIGMGGEWGLGASLAMESLPTESRGLFSGILQQAMLWLFAGCRCLWHPLHPVPRHELACPVRHRRPACPIGGIHSYGRR